MSFQTFEFSNVSRYRQLKQMSLIRKRCGFGFRQMYISANMVRFSVFRIELNVALAQTCNLFCMEMRNKREREVRDILSV